MIIIPIAWIALLVVIVAMCKMAARADAIETARPRALPAQRPKPVPTHWAAVPATRTRLTRRRTHRHSQPIA
ncbi:MAG TPA: hypothetical protein VID48_09715 [Solirubrobacteraceae bacterium]